MAGLARPSAAAPWASAGYRQFLSADQNLPRFTRLNSSELTDRLNRAGRRRGALRLPVRELARQIRERWCVRMSGQAQRSSTKTPYCGGASKQQRRTPQQITVDHALRQDIETLIPPLKRYARQLTRDPMAADDLVQDCLARALGKIHLWDPETDLRAWLFTILHNQHISLARRDMRQRAYSQRLNLESSCALGPAQGVRLELRDVERALARLPEEQRSVILLIGLEGMGYEEAASAVNLPVGTVRSRVSRGREALRMMTGLFPARHGREARSQPGWRSPRRLRRVSRWTPTLSSRPKPSITASIAVPP
jgi:RNA polymerase sigma factor (sigma-70 family)